MDIIKATNLRGREVLIDTYGGKNPREWRLLLQTEGGDKLHQHVIAADVIEAVRIARAAMTFVEVLAVEMTEVRAAVA